MEFPVLDSQKLAELVQLEQDGNPGLVDQLTAVFFAEATESLQRMRDGVRGKDSETVWHEAHKVKSSSGSLGATRMAHLCGRIESLGKSGVLAEVPLLIEQAEVAFLSFQQALREGVR